MYSEERSSLTFMNSQPVGEAPIVDWPAVLDRVGGDEELMQEIVGLFLEEYPTLYSEIRSSVERQDARGLEYSAHTLKGSVSNFGAQLVTQTALDLELMGRRNEFHQAPASLERLSMELASLHIALSQRASQ
jgi:HPt (histidine-containing phosphotransfer) domain-containing protein